LLKGALVKIPDDPFVRELLPEFVDSWINDIETQFHDYIEKKNTDDLYRLAHTLKGSCFQFGLDEVAQLGIELMGYAKNKDWDNASRLYQSIIDSFYGVKQFLKENIK
jgi:HPt (histidine-containing phosphotransfer) domain-containing protein